MAASLCRLAGLLAVALALPACSVLPVQHDRDTTALDANQLEPKQGLGPTFQEASDAEDATFRDRLDVDLQLAVADLGTFYNLPNLGRLALGVAAAAPVANTTADQHFRDWYQQRVHGGTVDSFAEVFKYSGQLWVVAPVGLELAGLAGKAGEDYQHDGGWYEWANRSNRAIALGYPVVFGVAAVLGAERPDKRDSHWQSFGDVPGVSGHTFIGAIPFLTAAAMTDDWRWKAPLVLGSFLTGWSRIHDDRHYLSQVGLGWWIAALTVLSVSETQESATWTVKPTVGPEGAGVGVQLRY